MVHTLVSTRRGTIIVSLLAALAAGLLIMFYVSHYRDSVKAEGAPVTVLEARQMIRKGTPGNVIASRSLYTATTIRESQLVDGAYSDPSSLRGKVATHDIYPGAQLASSAFAAATHNAASALTDRQRIMSVPLDAAHGLVGEVEAGDHVDVYAGFNVIPLNADGTPVSGGQSRPVMRRILTDVPVVGVSASKGGLAASGGSAVELRVGDQQAAELAFASDNGKVWLALRPTAGAASTAPSIVTMETMLLGVRPTTVLHSFRGQR
jgi:Flp pilus assembly protein CpaB